MKPFRAAAAVVGMAMLAGCDIPTSIPKVDQRWILPADSVSISVDQLVPSGVTVSGGSFDVTVNPFTTSETLGNLCNVCVNGAPGPMPPFDGTFTTSQSLPADVTGATITSGSIQLSIQNGLSFDPIAGGGMLEITLTDGPGGAQVGQVMLDGATDSLPSGSTRILTMDLAPGAVGSTLVATTEVKSVGGQAAFTNTANQVSLTATPTPILVSSASVDVTNRTADISQVSLDVKNIDQSVINHILEGALILDIQNPFGISLDGQLVINTPSGPINGNLSVSSGSSSTATISYSQNDFQRFLGQDNVSLSGSMTVGPGAGVITVTPGERAVLNAKLDLTIEIGG